MSPIVSVIIPNYNYSAFLKQRIDSVLQQTFNDIEVIILDDNSSDNSKDVIESYRGEPHVSHIVYNEENSGSTFKQWRKGFDLARGEFIWIAEADDFADTSLLEKLLCVMCKDTDIKVGFVNSNWVTPTSTFINPDYTIAQPQKEYDGTLFVREHLLKENYIYNASMAVFRKDAILTMNDDYMTFKSCGDKLFWRDIALQGKVLFVCEPLNNFRIHDAKVTTNSISSGLLFREEHRLFGMNISAGLIDNKNRMEVVLYFLQYINNVKETLTSEDVYKSIYQLWHTEIDYHNCNLPLVFRTRCWWHSLRHQVKAIFRKASSPLSNDKL